MMKQDVRRTEQVAALGKKTKQKKLTCILRSRPASPRTDRRRAPALAKPRYLTRS